MEYLSLLTRAGIALIISFFLGVILAPLVIFLAKKLHAGQPILHYVSLHEKKQGTPTMGGWIFIVPTMLLTGIFCYKDGISIGVIASFVMLSFAVLGFLDDFIKVKTKENMGLRPYQKILGQVSIAIIVAFYAYKNIGSGVYIPFYSKTINFGWWYIPFTTFVYLAMSNCVNLTDGIDGLAGSCTVVYLATFFIVILLAIISGTVTKLSTLLIFDATLLGAVLAYLIFNTNKAKIFMGDTGSLALGGASAAISIFVAQPFLILFVGIMYVLSGITIIMQVCYFRITRGKRIFLMAPYHHHLEKKGYTEAQIVNIYSTVTFMMGILAILSVMWGSYGGVFK